MSVNIQKINYYNITVKDQPGEAYNVLTYLKDLGVNMLAFAAIPMGPNTIVLTVFPENSGKLSKEMKYSGKSLDGPHKAFLIQGDDQLGALINIHQKLFDANINVSASSGIADGKGHYGYIIYIRTGEFEKAAHALGL